jgi:sugar phosphate isomerase/epimerase
VKLSISEISTPGTTFAEDLAAYRAAGCGGIGIWEFKLTDDAADLAALRDSGLTATNCVPAVPLVLPAPGFEQPADPEVRTEAIEASIRRLAAFEPDCVVCLTGPVGTFDDEEDEARGIVVECLRCLADVAEEVGVRLGLEPVHSSQHELYSFVNTVPETLTLLDEARRPSVGVMFDTYHLWDTPTVLDDIAQHLDRITGVHVADFREPPRSDSDRVLPGDGVADIAGLVDAFARAGWDGFYDVEIFSGAELDGSLWTLPVDRFAQRAVESMRRITAS